MAMRCGTNMNKFAAGSFVVFSFWTTAQNMNIFVAVQPLTWIQSLEGVQAKYSFLFYPIQKPDGGSSLPSAFGSL